MDRGDKIVYCIGSIAVIVAVVTSITLAVLYPVQTKPNKSVLYNLSDFIMEYDGHKFFFHGYSDELNLLIGDYYNGTMSNMEVYISVIHGNAFTLGNQTYIVRETHHASTTVRLEKVEP